MNSTIINVLCDVLGDPDLSDFSVPGSCPLRSRWLCFGAFLKPEALKAVTLNPKGLF